ncbi:hypothetical protein SNE40_005240 [Patella caerulea]|uniref:unspecific monooxygenase n=1 Tax=Patella caerulea TaxID=87958 RepID=A0AAN8PW34_PATCE
MDIVNSIVERLRTPFSWLTTPVIISTFVVGLCVVLLADYFRLKRNKIPGPRGVPFFGYLPFFGKNPQKTFFNLRKRYGDIFSIQMGSFPAVVIHGKDVIREALVTSGDDFAGRPNFYTTQLLDNGESLTFGTFGPRRALQRKIASNVLYVFANARTNPLEDIIQEEVERLCSDFGKMKGAAFDPSEGIYVSVGSVLYQLCYGRNEEIRNDDNFLQFVKVSGDFTKFTGAGNPVDVMPWLRFVMPWKLTKFWAVVHKLEVIIESKLKEEAATYSEDNRRHLTDGLLKAAIEVEADPEHGLTGDHVRNVMADITSAGFETLSTTLTWAVLLLANNLTVQRKVHEAIDDVIGSRSPRLDDKPTLHYTMATINEIMRFSNIVPLAVPHAATRDTELRGYKIREGTILLPNFYSVSHDEQTWGDPNNFRPERYLDENGELDKNKTDLFTPFSLGRRKCLGEFLARMEVFLFFTAILQRCEFRKPASVEEYNLEGSFGLTIKPEPYNVAVTLRT